MGCNSVYDQLISQLTACREGGDRGHPALERGCLLRMDFTAYRAECGEEAGLSFPEVSSQ